MPEDAFDANDAPEPWNPAEVLRNIVAEREAFADEIKTSEDHVRRIMRENSPLAAQSIVWLMQHSTSEKLRFDAARYIVERAVGKLRDAGDFLDEDENNPTLALLRKVISVN